MKKLIIGVFAMSLLVSCGSTEKANDKSAEKAKAENAEKAKPQTVKGEYEKM